MNKQRKIVITLTLILILSLSMLPLTVQAKRGKSKKVKPWKLPKKGKIETYPLGNGLTMFKEYIPLSPELMANNLDLPVEELPDGLFYTVNVFALEVPIPVSDVYDEDDDADDEDDECTDTMVILIDVGDQRLAKKLFKAVKKAYKQKPDAVYVTHYHSDHAGGGTYFQKKDVPVYAPMTEGMFIELGAAVSPEVPPEFTYKGYTPDHYYELSTLAPGFDIIEASGHTMGAVHVEYRSDYTAFLFTSDTILPRESDKVNELDMTYLLTVGTAYQNYLNSNLPPVFFDFYHEQLETLDETSSTVWGYELILNGHTPALEPMYAAGYITATIMTMGHFPYL